ncbi:MAG: inner-rane translocator [Rubrobacteraceae bacterium]|jgi:simple sugar transport system permease protein|nr:inner-rane translocator [Rubrobacteraceae bacterium]
MAQSATGGKPVRDVGALRRLLTRPELAAVAGSILVFAFFAVVAGDYGFLTTAGAASYLEVAAQLGIVAVPVALLMIAGEFDLSVGSMVGAAGMIIAISVSEYGLPLLVGVLLAFAVALVVGFLNGYLVIKTGLPSFIVTLGMLFALRGLTIGFARLLTGRTQIGLGDSGSGVMQTLFAGSIGDFPVSIIWWFALAVLGTYVLQRTVFGNWIFGAGGDANAARNVGVPVSRVKITLFMCTAASAALLATIQVLDAGSADVLRGTLLELQAIAAAVIGGVLLTGGYGSVIGALFGALIFGMVQQGIFFTGVSTDWFQVFVGVMLLIAVMFNNVIRRRAAEAR